MLHACYMCEHRVEPPNKGYFWDQPFCPLQSSFVPRPHPFLEVGLVNNLGCAESAIHKNATTTAPSKVTRYSVFQVGCPEEIKNLVLYK